MTVSITAAEFDRMTGHRKRHKFNAKRTVVDGISFPSKAEANRWCDLRTLEVNGKIQNLRRQVRFPLTVNGILICTYIADFTYRQDGKPVIEDKKGVVTPLYALKRKLFAAVYGATITET